MGQYFFSIYWAFQLGFLIKTDRQFIRIEIPFLTIIFGLSKDAKGSNLLDMWKAYLERKKKMEPHCHLCGKETEIDFVCEKCEEFYCEDCSAKYTIHTQIDYSCCESCSNVYID